MKSFSGKIWNFLECDQELISDIKRNSEINDLVARILINRGFSDASEIDAFLNAKLKNTIPDPSLLLDMDNAVQRTVEAIFKKQNITIFGDYDVDGITSTYLIVKYLNILGLSPKYYVPNRFSDGYGVSKESIQKAIDDQADLLITVDSGINSINEVEFANLSNLDVIILDHHIQISEKLPNAKAVVNPNRRDQKGIPNAHINNLCAAGVVFMFMIALQRELRNKNFFENKNEPNLLDFIDIVTLGTLCDVMEIKGINRAIVKYFMKTEKYSTGITSLMTAFNIEKITSPEDLSFFIGPAINAAGRVGDPSVALNLLLEDSPEKSLKIAGALIDLNKQRKRLEKQFLADAMFMVLENELFNNKGICVFGDHWHEGVIGIIAGRLKDKFQKPSFVISFNSDGIGKGSARSVPGIHLGDFFEKAKLNNVIINGGGHSLAGGFSISKDQIEKFNEFLNLTISGEFINSINIDYTLSHISNLNQISKDLAKIEPFGKGIEKPVFCMKRVRIKNVKKTNSGSHLMMNFSGEFGDGNIRAVIFSTSSKSDIVNSIDENKDGLFDIVGSINFHEQFGGSIVIEDIRLSVSTQLI